MYDELTLQITELDRFFVNRNLTSQIDRHFFFLSNCAQTSRSQYLLNPIRMSLVNSFFFVKVACLGIWKPETPGQACCRVHESKTESLLFKINISKFLSEA